MAVYTVVPRKRQPGYRVDIITDDGSRHSILGFDTADEARVWIEESRRLETLQFFSPEED